MTTATHRRSGPPGSAVRWTWAVVIALMAALAVLVHHETAAAAIAQTPAPAMGAMAGMNHASHSTGMTPAAVTGGDEVHRTPNLPADDDSSPCSSMVMNHCSAASLDTVKLVPPAATFHTLPVDASYGVLTRQAPPGTAYRAPPDLSVLSRLLI